MNLPLPKASLAGCYWLPRIIAKARLFVRGKLEEEYVWAFCHHRGVDGQFLNHFRLSKEEIVAVSSLDEAKIESWFLALESVDDQRIQEWNELAVNLGREGYPMDRVFKLAMTKIYKIPKAELHKTVFEAIEADEVVG
jgi:hypothetical protein